MNSYKFLHFCSLWNVLENMFEEQVRAFDAVNGGQKFQKTA